MNLPRLVAYATNSEIDRLSPDSLQLTINEEPLSSASMVMGKGKKMNVGDWVRVFAPGHGDVYRIKSVSEDTHGQQTVSLEHGFGILQDSVIFGEMDSTALGGNADGVSADACMRALLNKQSTRHWVYESCEFSDITLPWTFSDTSVYSALISMASALEDSVFVFDMSAYPWKVSLKKRPRSVVCEMRKGRNISTMTTLVDKSDMYTRIYPVGGNDLHIDETYLEKNTATWGVIGKVYNDQSITKKELLKAKAQKMLDKYSQPLVTVTIAGLELSERTGEPMDRLGIGTMCRVPLPEYGTSITERITSLNYPDLISQPGVVNVTLANKRETLTSVVKKVAGGGGGGASAAAVKEEVKKIWTEFEQTDAAIRLAAYNIGLLQTDMSSIKIMANEIESVVNQYHYDSTGDLLRAYRSAITQNASNLQLKVSYTDFNGNEIASRINMGTTTIDISASKINLSGYVTASQLSAANARIDNLISGATTISNLSAGRVGCTALDLNGDTFTNAIVVTINDVRYLLVGRRVST